MTGTQQNQQQDELRDLDVPDLQAERVTGGSLENSLVSHLTAKPKPKGGGTAGAGWDIRSSPKGM